MPSYPPGRQTPDPSFASRPAYPNAPASISSPPSAPQPIDATTFSPLLAFLTRGLPTPSPPKSKSVLEAENRRTYGNRLGLGVPRSFFTGAGGGSTPNPTQNMTPTLRPEFRVRNPRLKLSGPPKSTSAPWTPNDPNHPAVGVTLA